MASIERKQKMQLKIVHVKMIENSECDFSVSSLNKVVLVDRKVDTYNSLKKLVLDEFFQGQNINPELFRLRAYNVQFQILLDTYEGREDMTLELLKIYPMKTLALEERPNA